jgi:hypothetical protein
MMIVMHGTSSSLLGDVRYASLDLSNRIVLKQADFEVEVCEDAGRRSLCGQDLRYDYIILCRTFCCLKNDSVPFHHLIRIVVV